MYRLLHGLVHTSRQHAQTEERQKRRDRHRQIDSEKESKRGVSDLVIEFVICFLALGVRGQERSILSMVCLVMLLIHHGDGGGDDDDDDYSDDDGGNGGVMLEGDCV